MVKFKDMKIGIFKGVDYETLFPVGKSIVETIKTIIPEEKHAARDLASPALANDARLIIISPPDQLVAKPVPPGNTLLLAYKFIIDSFIAYLNELSRKFKQDFDRLIDRAQNNIDEANLITAELLSHFLVKFAERVRNISINDTSIRIEDLGDFEGDENWGEGESEGEGEGRGGGCIGRGECVPTGRTGQGGEGWTKAQEEEQNKAKDTGKQIADDTKGEEIDDIIKDLEDREKAKAMAGKIGTSFNISGEERKIIERLVTNNPELSKVVIILYQLLLKAEPSKLVSQKYIPPPPRGTEPFGYRAGTAEEALRELGEVAPEEVIRLLDPDLFLSLLVSGENVLMRDIRTPKNSAIYVLVDKSGSTSANAKTLRGFSDYTYLQIEKAIALLLLLAARRAGAYYCLRFFDTETYPPSDDFPLCVNVRGRVGGQLQALLDYLKGVTPGGGTSIQDALMVALSDLINKKNMFKDFSYILLLTDGEDEVNADALLPLFKQAKARLIASSLSTVNPSLKRLAEATGGLYFDHTFRDLDTLYKSLRKSLSKL